MAGFMDNLNKGLTTINLKTSNFVESSKYKTAISNKEKEISSLMKYIGEIVYVNRSNFSWDMIENQIAEIEEKYASIEDLKNQIEQLEKKEQDILGSNSTAGNAAKLYCPMCGAPNHVESRFCEKCGSKLP